MAENKQPPATLAGSISQAAAPNAVKANEAEQAANNLVTAELLKEEAVAGDLKFGDKLLASGTGADQVNPLTAQNIPLGKPTLVVFDRWIQIQLGAEVLTRHKL